MLCKPVLEIFPFHGLTPYCKFRKSSNHFKGYRLKQSWFYCLSAQCDIISFVQVLKWVWLLPATRQRRKKNNRLCTVSEPRNKNYCERWHQPTFKILLKYYFIFTSSNTYVYVRITTSSSCLASNFRTRPWKTIPVQNGHLLLVIYDVWNQTCIINNNDPYNPGGNEKLYGKEIKYENVTLL